jgi:hypothetical protein
MVYGSYLKIWQSWLRQFICGPIFELEREKKSAKIFGMLFLKKLATLAKTIDFELEK